MTYSDTLEYLYTRLPMYQRVGKIAYKKDLGNTTALLEFLDNPHQKFKSIHIAGTNGKGTSAHGIAAILQSSGYKTGLYTSPHLKNFTERIRINGFEMNQADVVSFVERIKPAIEQVEPSFFEITVAMAFDYFAQHGVDIAVIETGLGGRLDSTNVITPEVCLITNIGYDHMDLLGDTLEKIALEKAGIMKPGVPVVIGEAEGSVKAVFEGYAEETGSPLILAQKSDWKPESRLVPEYLIRNYPGMIAVATQLAKQGWRIRQELINSSIAEMAELTGLKGRFQVLEESPLVIADVSHNPDGLKVLFDQVKTLCKGNLHLVFGTVKEKDLSPIFKLFPTTSVIWTQSSVPRALTVEELAIQGIMNGIQGECYREVNEAIKKAKEKALPNDVILITGSTFVVAEIDDL